MRPRYCPCKYETPDPCPACGATVAGNDKVRGICQATHGSEPVPLVELVTVRKDSFYKTEPQEEYRITTLHDSRERYTI